MSDPDDWIGRSWTRTERITERQLKHFSATLTGMLAPGEVPPGFHWCLAPDCAEREDLGRDGHPKPGIFVPRLSLPRRMWAGGSLRHHGPFAPGETVTREITISDITYKTGSTGPLAFVKVRHLWTVEGAIRLDEMQDIVYREDPKPADQPTYPKPAEEWPDGRSWETTTDPVLLFRYSALTFNGHRIHYDHSYATGVEGYEGLVVHGPLQAVWMLNLAAEILGRAPAVYTYRGVAPLICGTPVRIEARDAQDEILLRVRRPDGVVTMQGRARAEL